MFEKWKGKRAQQTSNGDRPPTLLAMTGSPADAELLHAILATTGWEFRIVGDIEDAVAFLSTHGPSVVLCDRDLAGEDWRQAIRKLANGHGRVILASFVADDYLWEEVIQCGG